MKKIIDQKQIDSVNGVVLELLRDLGRDELELYYYELRSAPKGFGGKTMEWHATSYPNLVAPESTLFTRAQLEEKLTSLLVELRDNRCDKTQRQLSWEVDGELIDICFFG